MRTTCSTITFQRPFTLNATAGELPPGSYEIETDEEGIVATDRRAFHRVAIYLYVKTSASTRTIIASAADLAAVLERDAPALA